MIRKPAERMAAEAMAGTPYARRWPETTEAAGQ